MHSVVRLLTAVWLLSLCACASRQLDFTWKPKEVNGRKVILFVPGLYGSALAETKSGSRVFQTLGQALWGKIPLALSGKELGIEDARELRADGVLDGVNVIPLIYTADGYGDTFDYLTDTFSKKTKVIPFAYDWRRNNVEAAQLLGRKIRQLRAAGAKSIALVGHSLGALLVAYYLRYGEQELEKAEENWEGTKYVDAAVVAGGPYAGSMTSFHDFLRGTSVGLSSTPLAAESIGTFYSFYQFLPRVETGYFLSPDMSSFGEALFSVDNWRKWNAGLFSGDKKAKGPLLLKRTKYTERALSVGRKFSDLMARPQSHPPIRKISLLAISGTGKKTLGRAYWSGKQWLFKDKAMREITGSEVATLLEDGDGLVTTASSKLPAAFNSLAVQIFQFPMEHRGMYLQSDVQDKVTPFLTSLGY